MEIKLQIMLKLFYFFIYLFILFIYLFIYLFYRSIKQKFFLECSKYVKLWSKRTLELLMVKM